MREGASVGVSTSISKPVKMDVSTPLSARSWYNASVSFSSDACKDTGVMIS